MIKLGIKSLIVVVLATASSFAQQTKPVAGYPHPFVEINGNLNGGGYSPFSANGRAGVDVEEKYTILKVYGTYDFVKKTDDGTIGNRNGHQNTVEGELFGRFPSGFYLGGGYGHTQLSTTNYNKMHDIYLLGGGYDSLGRYTYRVQGEYLGVRNEKVTYPNATSCTANYCSSGTRGVDINIWYPSPATNSHWFVHGDFETIFFHNYRQTSHSVAPFFSIGLSYRF